MQAVHIYADRQCKGEWRPFALSVKKTYNAKRPYDELRPLKRSRRLLRPWLGLSEEKVDREKGH